ncbi:MAG TPA: ATPase [Rhodospirillales bacterium]|nr:ATPase [Rhodospirillales bacterium]
MTNRHSHIIVTGNEKGGSGKSTTAMHLVIGLMRDGHSVACIDLDARQGTLSRYLENRKSFTGSHAIDLPQPQAHAIETDSPDATSTLDRLIRELTVTCDFIVIDTPGNDSPLSRHGHSYADTLITPMNDSFIDLDVLARVNPQSLRIEKPSHYAEIVWQQKMVRAKRDGGSIDWIVMRNRLSSLDARNKRQIEGVLAELAKRVGFRLVAGFGERVIYRELFLNGLTMLDIRDVIDAGAMIGDAGGGLNMSHLAARQEVRNLLNAVTNHGR